MLKKEKKLLTFFTFLVLSICASISFSAEASADTIIPINHPNATPNHKALVVLVNFNDRKIISTDQEWSNVVFSNQGSTVRNYYDEITGGKVIFGPASENNGTSNDGVIRISINANHPGPAGVTTEASSLAFDNLRSTILDNVSQLVNLSSYDTNGDKTIDTKELNIILVVAGFDSRSAVEKPCLRPHASLLGETFQYNTLKFNGVFANLAELVRFYPTINKYTIEDFGSICHELAHTYGAVDLYTPNGGVEGSNMGRYSLMGRGDGHIDAYNMMLMGFVEPKVSNRTGTYTVNTVNSSNGYNVLRINTINPKEYFLVENRQFEGFDKYLYSTDIADSCTYSGIAVYHIDKNQIPCRVSIIRNRTNTLFSKEFDFSSLSDITDPSSKLNSPRVDLPGANNYNSNFGLDVLSNNSDSMQVKITAEEIYTDYNTSPIIDSFTASSKNIKNGSVNIKAVIRNIIPQDLGTNTSLNLGMNIGMSNYSISDGWKYMGNNTYEISINPDDYFPEGGDISFRLQVSSSTTVNWTGPKLVVTVNHNAGNSNLALNKPATASVQLSTQPASKALNGTTYRDTKTLSDKWCTGIGSGNNSWLKVDLGSIMTINRWKVIHEKGSGSYYTDYCTSDFRLQTSDNGTDNWKDIDIVKGNTLGITDRDVVPFRARYVRLYIDKADSDNCARIYEFQLYNDNLTGISTDFEGNKTCDSNGFIRYLGNPHYTNNIAYSSYVTGPECSQITNEVYHSGSSAIRISGTDNGNTGSYSYHPIYDDVFIPVTSSTVLSYWINPVNQNGRFVGIDILFTDGSNLRELTTAVDQNGIGMHPDCGRGVVGQWNLIKCNLGQYENGKTIKRIMLAYDQPAATGQYMAYVDDISIWDASIKTNGVVADFEGLNITPTNDLNKPLGVLDNYNSIELSNYVTGDANGSPVCTTKTDGTAHTGKGSLLISGNDNGLYSSFSYFNLYDNLNISVTSNTNLSYWMYPVNANGRFVGIEIQFADGSYLRTSGAVDINGVSMHPDGGIWNQMPGLGGRGVVGQWNYISSNIGKWCNGKTIKKLMVAYDQPGSTGQFTTYVDDIVIK